MRGLCGWFAGEARADGPTALGRMLGAAAPADPAAPAPLQRAAGGSLVASYGAHGRPALLEVDGLLLAASGHPRWRRASVPGGDLAAIAAALAAEGPAALASVGGDFALAAWDSRRQRGLLAVDRMGVHPLCYVPVRGGLAFASTLDALVAHPDVTRQLAPQMVYDYLHYHVCPGPQTIYDGMLRVPAGQVVEFAAGRVETPRPFWMPRFEEQRDASFEPLKREFTDLLEAAVKEASDSEGSGAFLSGGTDSSTVCGMLKRVRPAPARAFSIGFDVPGYDETGYARIAAKHFGLEHHEYYVTKDDVVGCVGPIATSYDQPFGNASAVPTYHCARFAREHGITRLLAGDGGDELFGGNQRYAKQHLLAHYGRLPGALRRGLVEPLLMSTPLGGVPPLRKLRSYVEQARPPMPHRYENYNLLQHLGAHNVLTREFLASVDITHPARLLEDAHRPVASASLINQMLAIDMRFVLADGDLPKVSNMCNLAGVDVAYPLLDDRILAFSERLPSDMKLRGTALRWFFKKALDDFLPQEIITKSKHGFGLPVGPWLVEHPPLLARAAAAIDHVRARGIVQGAFVDGLMRGKLHEHPAYYGSMVWVLMMLGLWLESRGL